MNSWLKPPVTIGMLYNFCMVENIDTEMVLPFYKFSGSHYEIGVQYGSSCRELIIDNLDQSMRRLLDRSHATCEEVLASALLYRPSVLQYAPFLDEEIQGISTSTGLRLEEVYFLQLRAEVQARFTNSDRHRHTTECTTFAISGLGTFDRTPLAGQNADLPAFYTKLCVVVEIAAQGQPAILMVTPAGQLSYIGMNEDGVCAFANYLVCSGWRVGFPRYCLTRLALTQEDVEKATKALLNVQRASSRNVLLLDLQGEMMDLEFAVEKHARVNPSNGRLIHTNHFISPELHCEERAEKEDLANSQARMKRLEHLIAGEFGSLNGDRMQTCLRDRATYPDAICIEPGDPGQGDEMTVVSVIAEPAKKRLWIAPGPPSRHAYQAYPFTIIHNSE